MKQAFYQRIRYGIYCVVLMAGIVFSLPQTRAFFAGMGHRWLCIAVLSFSISFCLVPVCKRLAFRFSILDIPDKRKIHQNPTPLLGGLAIFFAFTVSILINGIYTVKLVTMLISAGAIFAISLADDFKEIPASIKLLFQLAATACVMSQGIVLRVIPGTFGFFADAGNGLLTILWIVGITNALNFFDGMDGLAAGLGAIISLFVGMVAFQTNNVAVGWISLSMMCGCLGFLPYNFRFRKSASIFLGDAGSTFIGFTLACLAVCGEWAENDPILALCSPVLIFWILIFDMAHITVDRIAKGKVHSVRQWLEYVGKDHLHHRLNNVLQSPKKSVLFIYSLSFCLGISAVVLRYARTIDAFLLLAQAIIIVGLLTILERRGRIE